MRWPWKRHPDDHAAAQRGREIEVRTSAAEREAQEAIRRARAARARAEHHIRENHLGPTFDIALRESR